MHIQMSAKGLAEARGEGQILVAKMAVLLKFRVQLHFIWKNCFHNINDGSLEVFSNKICAIY